MKTFIRKSLTLTLTIILVAITTPFFTIRAAALPAADNRIAEARGTMALAQAVRKLGVVASVLHTGAHPDDEDSSLLAYLARGRQARTAYLSLTRGDGGQNLIGPELYEALGVIRTEELLAARRLDGAEQFFSRAYDFGFSKSRTEALSKWDREAVLSDIVRVIRTFRPMIIVSAWSGTPNDGHGHHQAAGLLTNEAFRAASDPKRFPEQIEEGLKPWQVRKLYIKSSDFGQAGRGPQLQLSTLSINTGQYDAVLGRSYSEIATQGRNQHRTQDQDSIERRGPRMSRLRLVESSIGPIREEKDIFEGLDTRLTGIAQFAGKGRDALIKPLEEAQQEADNAAGKFNPFSPSLIRQNIVNGLGKIKQARAALAGLGLSEAELYDTDLLLKQKENDFNDALIKSAGVVVDCLADDEIVTPGETFTVRVERYSDASTGPAEVSLLLPQGWSAVQGEKKDSIVEDSRVSSSEFKVTVPQDADFSEPYWLKHARKGDMFSPGKGGTGIEPHAPPAVMAKLEFEIAGQRVFVTQPAQYRFAGKGQGELWRELKVAPAISVNVSPTVLVYPVSASPLKREVTISLTNNIKKGARGTLKLNGIPAAWQVTPQSAEFDLKRDGERTSFTFTVVTPANSPETRQEISAVATVDGKEYRRGYQVVSYSHIEPRFVFQDARSEAEVIDAKVAPGLKVGYIEGAGDDFANALKRLGVDVEILDTREVSSGDLSRFDTIVLGVRVYEVRSDVIANNARLLDYVNRGGTLIVQYNKTSYEEGDYAPYPTSRRERQSPENRSIEREPRLTYLDEATLKQALRGKAAAGIKIGYIGSPADQFLKDEHLAGTSIKLIDSAELATGDLNQYDLIVSGVGANQARADLIANNSRILNFARRKTVVALYSKDEYLSGKFPAYPKPESRPFRVTDEQAAVAILDPASPLFNFPNKITERDFGGWVSERGAYFLSEWDARFKPVLASRDSGEEPQKGGELIAEYGKGFYIYSAYAWFRQLPQGVPGAYRLIANMVSLPKAAKRSAR